MYNPSVSSTQYRIGESFQDIWINPKTGKVPHINSYKDGDDTSKIEYIMNQTAAKGRYHIGINGVTGKNKPFGHVVTAERLSNGKLYVYDPQKDRFVDISQWSRLTEVEVLKVDKLVFRESLLKDIATSRI